MNDLDLWMVQSLLQSKGSSGAIYEQEKDNNVLLQLLLAVSHQFSSGSTENDQNNSATKATIYMIDDGAPEFFVLTGFSEPVVWYSKPYVAKYLTYRNLIMTEEGIDTIGTANLFETVGSFYLSTGNESFAQTCLIQALIEMPIYTSDIDQYNRLTESAHRSYFYGQSSPECDSAMVALYFGLAHEIGHLCDKKDSTSESHTHPESLDDKDICNALLQAGKDYFSALTMPGYERWAAKLEREAGDVSSMLGVSNLRSEIKADWAGFQILLRFIESAYKFKGKTYSKKVLASEVIIGLFIIELIQVCQHIAKVNNERVSGLSNAERDTRLSSLYFPLREVDDNALRASLATNDILIDFAISHWARINFLKPTLSTVVLLHLFPETYKVQDDTLIATVNPPELQRRIEIAKGNLEGYFQFYFSACMKLLHRLEDVLSFVGHMVTNSPLPSSVLNSAGESNFDSAIYGNFATHINRLEGAGEAGRTRMREIAERLEEYAAAFKRRGLENSWMIETGRRLIR
jgi:hypothetical protein